MLEKKSGAKEMDTLNNPLQSPIFKKTFVKKNKKINEKVKQTSEPLSRSSTRTNALSNLYKRSIHVPQVIKKNDNKVEVEVDSKMFTLEEFLSGGSSKTNKPSTGNPMSDIFKNSDKSRNDSFTPSKNNKTVLLVGETPLKPRYFSSPMLCTPAKRCLDDHLLSPTAKRYR